MLIYEGVKTIIKKRGDEKYFRYTINLSGANIEESGFKEGDELVTEVKRGEIRLRRK